MLEFNEKVLRMLKDYLLNFIIFGVYVWGGQYGWRNLRLSLFDCGRDISQDEKLLKFNGRL
jgi:hypothetical protein